MRFLVVGETFLERFIYGRVERVAHQAPIPIVVAEREHVMAGGAATATANLRALGHTVFLATAAGTDAAGDALLAALYDIVPGPEMFLTRLHDRKTLVKNRIYARTGGAMNLVARWDIEESSLSPMHAVDGLVSWIKVHRPYDAALVLDYNRGLMIPAFCRAVLEATQAPVIVDTRSPDLDKYLGARILTANRVEYAVWPQPQELFERMAGLEAVLVKQDWEGLTLVTTDGIYRQPALPGPVQDVLGAGDTADAAFLAALAAGMSWADCLTMAALAGKEQVARVGIARVTDLPAFSRLKAAVENAGVS